MRIRLEASGRLPFWIIGDPAAPERDVTDGVPSYSQAINESIQISRNQQTVPGTEWEAKRFRDRGNQSVTIEATGHRIFTSYTERQEYIESLCPLDPDDELHRWQGDIWVRVNETGGVFRDSLLPDAVIALTGTKIEGATGLYLTYRIQAGGFDFSALREGVEGIGLLATAQTGDLMVVSLFGTTTGGAFSDAETVDTAGTITNPLPVGHRLQILAYDNVLPEIIVRDFQVVAPGGAATYPGHLAVEYPITDHLDVIAAAFASEEHMTASLVTDDGARDYVRLAWVTPAAGDITECKLFVIVADASNNIENGSYSDPESPKNLSTAMLKDASGAVLIADRITN